GGLAGIMAGPTATDGAPVRCLLPADAAASVRRDRRRLPACVHSALAAAADKTLAARPDRRARRWCWELYQRNRLDRLGPNRPWPDVQLLDDAWRRAVCQPTSRDDWTVRTRPASNVRRRPVCRN